MSETVEVAPGMLFGAENVHRVLGGTVVHEENEWTCEHHYYAFRDDELQCRQWAHSSFEAAAAAVAEPAESLRAYIEQREREAAEAEAWAEGMVKGLGQMRLHALEVASSRAQRASA